jgi:6-pyruvoyl-tetrahydropterin synthase related domain
MSGRGVGLAATAALSVVLTVLIAAPVLRAPSDRLFGMEVVGRHHDPFTVMEQFGRPLVLGVYFQPLTDVPGAWLARVTGRVAAYNGLVLATFPLSAVAAYLLARYLALSRTAAALTAIAFAFSPFHVAQAAYHPHIAQTQWVPLFLLALWRCLDDARPAAVVFLAFSVAGVTLSNFYGGLIAAVLTPVALVAYWVVKARRRPGAVRHLAVTLGGLAALAGAGAVYAWYATRGVPSPRAELAFVREDLFRYSAKWWSYLVPPLAHPLLGGLAHRVWDGAGVREGLLEQQVSLGGGIVALGLVALLAWLRRDLWPAATSLGMVPVLAVVALAALVCSLSPERTLGPITLWRPSALLYRMVPMFRAYARFGVVVQLMAALLAAIGAERLWGSRVRAVRWAGVALVALAVGEYAVWPPSLWRDVMPTDAHRWLVRQPERLRALDCAPLTAESESIRWLSAGRIALLGGAFDDCREPNLADKLAAAGYTHLIVRPGAPEAPWLGRPPEGLRLAVRFGDSEVFRVPERVPLVYTAEMTAFYPRESDGTGTWRWMGPEAYWTVVNRRGQQVVAALDVEMAAFQRTRRVRLLLDGAEVQTVVVEEPRGITRIGPLALPPGRHALAFQPTDPPTVAAELLNNGDRRPLSVRLGTWRWAVQG